MKKTITSGVALAMFVTSAAQAQDWAETLVGGVFRMAFPIALSAARGAVDLQYSHVNVDYDGNAFALNGLEIWPLGTRTAENPCKIEIERISFSGSDFWDSLDFQSSQIEASGISVPRACVADEPELAEVFDTVGLDTLEIQRAFLIVEHQLPTASTSIKLFAQSDDLLAISMTADLPYASIGEIDPYYGYGPDPIFEFSSATIEIESLGLWDRLAGAVPDRFFVPQAAGLLAQKYLEDILYQWNEAAYYKNDTGELSIHQLAFVYDVRDEVERFVREKDGITISLEARNGSVLLGEYLINDGKTFFSEMQPRIREVNQISTAAPSRKLLEDHIAGKPLSQADSLTLGRAFLTGHGVPKSQSRAANLLRPIALAGDAEAAELAASALEVSNPAEAYKFAVLGTCNGSKETLPVVDRLEGSLGLEQALAIQAEIMGDFPREIPTSGVTAVSDLAFMHLRGSGACRSYALAYFYASLCAAAGKIQCNSVLDELANRMHVDPSRSAIWSEIEEREAQLALEVWLYEGFADATVEAAYGNK